VHVSVIIPAFWSQATLRGCLDALRSQTQGGFEVIVVNSSPEEETRRIVSDYPEVLFAQSPVRLLPQGARNRGVEMARGELLVFTDPDCRARPDWLQRIVAAHHSGFPVVGGAMGVVRERTFELAIHLAKFSWLLPGLPAGPRAVVPTANAAYSRAAWARVGPFRGDVSVDDALMSLRAADCGMVPWFEPRALVEHHHDHSAAAYWREFLSRGREFGAGCARQRRWSRVHALARALLWPLVWLVVLGRCGRDALRAGWGARFLRALPLVGLYRMAWSLGEARACFEAALHARS
jgi:glycosyltransferase involved in cell wall biosynthesis